MIVDDVEMKSRRSLPQSVAAGEVLLAEFVLVKWVGEMAGEECVERR